jgi:hypothetical protein
MTTTIHHPSPSPRHPRWEAIKRSFTQSNYVTDFWNWLMTLLSKAAELVLFGSVLYSGYQLLPGITHAPAGVDALVFVIQQAALDIGGMGLLKLAKRAGLPRESFPVRVGITLVVLMILNVVLASLKQAMPVIPAAVFLWIETILLVARAVMAVLFGHAIHALREEYGETTITVKDAGELQQQVAALASELAQFRENVQQRMAANTEHFRQLEANMTERIAKSVTETGHRFTEQQQAVQAMTEQLSTDLGACRERIANSERHTQEQLRQLAAHTAQQVRQLFTEHTPKSEVWHDTEQHRSEQRTAPKRAKRTPKHVYRMLVTEGSERAKSEPHTTSEKGQFVRRCLAEEPTLRNSDIQRKAAALGLSISPAYVSETRKAFFAQQGAPSTAVASSETSTTHEEVA